MAAPTRCASSQSRATSSPPRSASRTAALDRLSANGGRLTAALADHRASLGASLDNLAALNAALAAGKDDLATILDKGNPLIATLADLVGDHKAELDCDLKVLEIVVDHSSTPEQCRRAARAARPSRPKPSPVCGTRATSRPTESGCASANILQPMNPPKQFVPPRALPPVTGAPGCVSLVPPSGADYYAGLRRAVIGQSRDGSLRSVVSWPRVRPPSCFDLYERPCEHRRSVAARPAANS